jgi:hypothetical protein
MRCLLRLMGTVFPRVGRDFLCCRSAMNPHEVDRMLKNLLEKDLRIQCRARRLSPAGGKDSLRERLKEDMLEKNDL